MFNKLNLCMCKISFICTSSQVKIFTLEGKFTNQNTTPPPLHPTFHFPFHSIPGHVYYLALAYKHCQYQSFCFWQVQGATQTVGPLYPMPPH